MRLKDAYELVKSKRYNIKPRKSFYYQLLIYDKWLRLKRTLRIISNRNNTL